MSVDRPTINLKRECEKNVINVNSQTRTLHFAPFTKDNTANNQRDVEFRFASSHRNQGDP